SQVREGQARRTTPDQSRRLRPTRVYPHPYRVLSPDHRDRCRRAAAQLLARRPAAGDCMATSIHVALADRSYDIEIGRGNLAQVAAFIQQRRKCTHAVVITDENVRPLHAKTTAESLGAAGVRTDLLSVPHGEGSKSVAQA